MEANQNTGVDLSNFLNSSKPQISAKRISKEEDKKKKNKKNIIIIVVCFVIMAALWTYYFIQNSVTY
jgi:hypothetical protein